MTKSLIVFGAAALFVLAGCSGEPKEGAKRADTPAWKGSAAGTNSAFAAQGWKPGDEASWESQMRARAQAQNEYARTATP